MCISVYSRPCGDQLAVQGGPGMSGAHHGGPQIPLTARTPLIITESPHQASQVHSGHPVCCGWHGLHQRYRYAFTTVLVVSSSNIEKAVLSWDTYYDMVTVCTSNITQQVCHKQQLTTISFCQQKELLHWSILLF